MTIVLNPSNPAYPLAPCDNVVIQRRGYHFARFLTDSGCAPEQAPPVGKRRLLHVINPFDPGAGSAGEGTQHLTYATMNEARDFALHTAPEAFSGIDFLAVAYPEDEAFARRFFSEVAPLEKSILDYETFKVPKKYPLLFDLFEPAIHRAADFVVMTNADICLMPGFYRAVGRLLDYGFDGLVINRRTVGDYALDPALAPLMASDLGMTHEGFDCFIFPRSMLSAFRRTLACVGAGGVMRSLIYNLVAQCQRLMILTDVHLTYHIGNDVTWQSRPDYTHHNWRAAIELLAHLAGRQPERFRNLCEALPERIRVADGPEGVKIIRAPNFTGLLPPEFDPPAPVLPGPASPQPTQP